MKKNNPGRFKVFISNTTVTVYLCIFQRTKLKVRLSNRIAEYLLIIMALFLIIITVHCNRMFLSLSLYTIVTHYNWLKDWSLPSPTEKPWQWGGKRLLLESHHAHAVTKIWRRFWGPSKVVTDFLKFKCSVNFLDTLHFNTWETSSRNHPQQMQSLRFLDTPPFQKFHFKFI